MDSRLQEILICPDCGARVRVESGTHCCSGCLRLIEIEGSTPILLPAGVGDDAVPTTQSRHGRVGHFMRESLGVGQVRVYKSRALRGRAERFVATFRPDELILNVGAGATSYGSNVVNLEIAPGAGIDVVGVGEALPFKDESFRGVILEAVLEHVPDADRTLREIRRVLTPSGHLYVDVPFIQGYHASPYDYRRYTLRGLRAVLEGHGYVVAESGVSVGPASATAWILGEFLGLCLSGSRGRRSRYAHAFAHLLIGPLRRLDAVLDRHPRAELIASGVYAIATRPAAVAEAGRAGTPQTGQRAA